MEPEQRALLERCMAAMAAGDAAFIFTLIEHFGGHLAGAVRRIVGEMGRTDVLGDTGEIDGLVQDIAFFLFDHAGAWQPDGGALPWVWAERGIRNIVASGVGHRVVAEPDDLEAEVTTAPGCGGDLGLDDLVDLLRDIPDLVLLFEALGVVCNDRNAQVFVEYRIQQRLGDQSPAATVGAMFDLSPANVRQIHHRVRARLAPMLSDDRYRPLADLALLSA